jgi:hypothetical protein
MCDAAKVASALTPDYALGGHTASLGLCWMPAGTFPGWPEGMAIGQHGSWNRSILSGYKLVFVPFADGRPAGPPRDILGGISGVDVAAEGLPDEGAYVAAYCRRTGRAAIPALDFYVAFNMFRFAAILHGNAPVEATCARLVAAPATP